MSLIWMGRCDYSLLSFLSLFFWCFSFGWGSLGGGFSWGSFGVFLWSGFGWSSFSWGSFWLWSWFGGFLGSFLVLKIFGEEFLVFDVSLIQGIHFENHRW